MAKRMNDAPATNTAYPVDAEAVELLAQRIVEDGDLHRWAALAHLDARRGTHTARDAIAAFITANGNLPR